MMLAAKIGGSSAADTLGSDTNYYLGVLTTIGSRKVTRGTIGGVHEVAAP